jgi:hypothetical protein
VKAQRIEDNSPEGRRLRALAKGAEQWGAILRFVGERSKRRDAEIEAMRPEERIAARLADDAELTAWEDIAHLFPGTDAELQESLKDPRFLERLERAKSKGRHVRALRLLAEEDRKAGLKGAMPTGRMSKPVPKSLIRDVVRARYPKQTKNLERWWKQYVEKPGIVVDEVNYRAFRIDVGQLLATLHKLTEADIAPLLP